jgi:hypothetical protein
MDTLSFALTAVTVDEGLVRKLAQAEHGRLIRLKDDETHRGWQTELYDALRAGQVEACVRSADTIWLLLSCHVDALQSEALRIHALDAAGDDIEPLARLFFQRDLARLAPCGVIRYVGALHLPVEPNWQVAATFMRALAVDLRAIQPDVWLVQMHSVCYSRFIRSADKMARCFTVQRDAAGNAVLAPTKKSEVGPHLAYVSINSSAHKVPWKAKPQAKLHDRFGLLSRILSQCQRTLGMRQVAVQVRPLQEYRPVGSTVQAKKELMHQTVMPEVAAALSGTRVHVYSHFGQPDYLVDILREMFPFLEWVPTDNPKAERGTISHLLAVVNNPETAIGGNADAKVVLRDASFPVMQCITEQTLQAIHSSIEKRLKRIAADLEQGVTEQRRPPQAHEVIGRALVMQLLLKTELRQSAFLLRRPWMDADLPWKRYAFIHHDYGNPKWVVVMPQSATRFEIRTIDRPSQIRMAQRIPVVIDPPEHGRDQRGQAFSNLVRSSRRALVIRSTEINAYCTHRKGHSGVWLIPELFAYLSQGADATSSDLSEKAAPRLRIVEAYEYGLPSLDAWRWEATLDMACLAYDPTVRMFRTAAFPIFVKLAAEVMDALTPPKAAS